MKGSRATTASPGALLLQRVVGTDAPLATLLVAIASTKVPILLKGGFWAMAHELRPDYSMLLGSAFLLAVGAGPVSLDARIWGRKDHDG